MRRGYVSSHTLSIDVAGYVSDLNDQFRLDCSEEDIKTDKDAKECAKFMKAYNNAAEATLKQRVKLFDIGGKKKFYDVF